MIFIIRDPRVRCTKSTSQGTVMPEVVLRCIACWTRVLDDMWMIYDDVLDLAYGVRRVMDVGCVTLNLTGSGS